MHVIQCPYRTIICMRQTRAHKKKSFNWELIKPTSLVNKSNICSSWRKRSSIFKIHKPNYHFSMMSHMQKIKKRTTTTEKMNNSFLLKYDGIYTHSATGKQRNKLSLLSPLCVICYASFKSFSLLNEASVCYNTNRSICVY